MAKIIQAGDLRNKIDFYIAAEGQNELGEDTQDGLEIYAENVPAQIIPQYGVNPGMMGDVDLTTVTHKIRIRSGAVDMRPDLVIMYEGQRYDVTFWMPVYNNGRFLELYAKMEVAV